MNPYDHLNGKIIELDSPVEFILIATIGGDRSVVAKSKGACIDLIAYAQKIQDPRNFLYRSSKPFGPVPPYTEEMSVFTIDSSPLENTPHPNYDHRLSELTFAWRGVSDNYLIDNLIEKFDKVAPEIVKSLGFTGAARIEWPLSIIIAECNESIIASKSKRQKKSAQLKMMAAIMLIYAFFGLATFLYFYLFKVIKI